MMPIAVQNGILLFLLSQSFQMEATGVRLNMPTFSHQQNVVKHIHHLGRGLQQADHGRHPQASRHLVLFMCNQVCVQEN